MSKFKLYVQYNLATFEWDKKKEKIVKGETFKDKVTFAKYIHSMLTKEEECDGKLLSLYDGQGNRWRVDPKTRKEV